MGDPSLAFRVPSRWGHSFIDPLGSTPYPGFIATTNPQGRLEGVPRALLGDPFPSSGPNANPLIEPRGKAAGIYSVVGTSEGQFFRQDFHPGINDRFNFTLQKEIFSRIVVDATFFMNIGHNQEINVPLNVADPRIGYEHQSALNQSVDNPFFGLPGEIVPGDLSSRRQVSVGDLVKPYPQYGNITLLGDGMGRQRYKAFQLKIQRPFANGFNFLIGYNYNRGKTDDFYDDVDAFDKRLDYQRDPLSGQSLTFSTIYELPFGHGRKWGSGMHPVANAIVGGWSISGIYRYLDGQLLHFGGMVVNGDPSVNNPARERWFNTDAFSRLPAFTRRTNPWFFDNVRGPFFSNIDMTFNKKFDIGEKLDLELRMEAYNLTNSFMGANPSTDVNSGNFGRITSQLNTHSGRELQYSIRFIW